MVGARRSSWRVISSIEQKTEGAEKKQAMVSFLFAAECLWTPKKHFLPPKNNLGLNLELYLFPPSASTEKYGLQIAI